WTLWVLLLAMLGLAEYFAKIPQARRRRTMIFLGTGRDRAQSLSGVRCSHLLPARATTTAQRRVVVLEVRARSGGERFQHVLPYRRRNTGKGALDWTPSFNPGVR